MNDHSWFKLLVRGIGILLIGMAVPMLLWNVSTMTLDGFRRDR
jgi:hypothetical protein